MGPTEIENIIEQFVRTQFAVSPTDDRFSTSTPLFEEGYVDSLGVAELLAHIEETFGVTIPDEDLMSEEFTTIAGAARVIHRLREVRQAA